MCCALPVAASVSVHELLSHCMRFRGKEVCKERSFGGKKKNSCVYCGSPHFFHGMHCDHSTIALYYDVFWRALFLSSIRYLAL